LQNLQINKSKGVRGVMDIKPLKIEKILVDGQGWIYSTDGQIKPFTVNGEMALITWYGQNLSDGTTRQFNGKYVIEIVWKS